MRSANVHLYDFARRSRLAQAPGTEVGLLDIVRAQHDRRIGVISHVQGLAAKIGVQVKVAAKGGRRSEAKVVSG